MSHVSLKIIGENPLAITPYEMRYEEDYNGSNPATLTCYSDDDTAGEPWLEGTALFWQVSHKGNQARQFGGIIQSVTTQTVQQNKENKYFFSIQLANPLATEKHTKRSRIWMDKTVLQIIQTMFANLNLSANANIDVSTCINTYPKIDHIVQYDQSNYSFLQTLCAEYGLTYYITIDNNADSPTFCINFSDDSTSYSQQTTSFALPSTQASNNTTIMHQLSCNSQTVPNMFQTEDYNPLDVSSNLIAKQNGAKEKDTPIGPISIFPAGKQTQKHLKQQLTNTVISATQTKKTFYFMTENMQCSLGTIADITKNTQLNQIKLPNTFLPIAITHSAQDQSNLQHATKQALALMHKQTGITRSDFYQNSITAINYNFQPYLPPLDTKHLAQIPDYFSGIVVGEDFKNQNTSGMQQHEFKNIYPDAFGRVRVYFPWDSNNPNKDYNLCPQMRVLTSQNGIAYAPHANDEVLVAAVNNRSDRFVIMGSAYNSDHKPPLNIADNNALAGIKTANALGNNPQYFYGDQTMQQERIVLKTSGDYFEFIGNCQDDTLCQHVKTIAQAYKQFVQGDMTLIVEKQSLTITAEESIKFHVNGNLLELLPDSINIIGGNINLKTPDGHIGELVTKGKQVKYPLDTGTVKQGSGNVLFEGQPASRVGDLIQHGIVDDSIAAGNNGILINGKVAAVLKSPTNADGQVSSGVGSVAAAQATEQELNVYHKNVIVNTALPPSLQPTHHHEKDDDALAELLYETKTKTLFALTHSELEEFTKEGNILDTAMQALVDANNSDDSHVIRNEKIISAKENLNELLQKVIKSPTSNHLSEFVAYTGKKYTYIDSNKIKNHWRQYKIDTEMKAHTIRKKDGSIDWKKLHQNLKPANGFMKKKLNFTVYQKQFINHSIGHWAQTINQHANFSDAIFGTKNNPKLNAEGCAQLLRFSAGVSVQARKFNLKNLSMSFNTTANAQLSLEDAKVKAHFYLPAKQGLHLIFSPMDRVGQSVQYLKTVDFGYIRASLNLGLEEFVGASVLASANMDFHLRPSDGKLQVKGDNNTSKKNGNKLEQVGVGVNAFAGAKAGGNAGAQASWQNPENELAWCQFASVVAEVDGAAGIGAEAQFYIKYNDIAKRFLIHAKAALVCGLGVSGSITFTVNIEHIYQFVMYVYHKIKDHRCAYIGFMADDAMLALTKMMVKYIVTEAEGLETIADAGAVVITEWWHNLSNAIKTREKIEAYTQSILNKPHRIAYTTPEVKGKLIAMLSDTWLLPQGQQTAILIILAFIQSQAEFINVMQHLTMDDTKISQKAGQKKLYNALGRYGRTELKQLHWFKEQINHHGLEVFYPNNVPVNTKATVCGKIIHKLKTDLNIFNESMNTAMNHEMF